jgi:hypothetical protein
VYRQYRRTCLKNLQSNLHDELKFTLEFALDNPKNYQIFHHRRMIAGVRDNNQEFSIDSPLCPSISSQIYISTCSSFDPFIHTYIHLFIHIRIHVSIYPMHEYIHLFLFIIYLSIYLSIRCSEWWIRRASLLWWDVSDR